jgi:hypothetical protein
MKLSTCFGRHTFHHQEPKLHWQPLVLHTWKVVGRVVGGCCQAQSGRGRADRPDHDHRHCYHHAPKVKPEAATAVVELLMMGVRTPETC